MSGWLASGSETEPEVAALGPYGPHGPRSGRCVTAGFTSLSQGVSLYLGCNTGVVSHFGLGRPKEPGGLQLPPTAKNRIFEGSTMKEDFSGWHFYKDLENGALSRERRSK